MGGSQRVVVVDVSAFALALALLGCGGPASDDEKACRIAADTINATDVALATYAKSGSAADRRAMETALFTTEPAAFVRARDRARDAGLKSYLTDLVRQTQASGSDVAMEKVDLRSGLFDACQRAGVEVTRVVTD